MIFERVHFILTHEPAAQEWFGPDHEILPFSFCSLSFILPRLVWTTATVGSHLYNYLYMGKSSARFRPTGGNIPYCLYQYYPTRSSAKTCRHCLVSKRRQYNIIYDVIYHNMKYRRFDSNPHTVSAYRSDMRCWPSHVANLECKGFNWNNSWNLLLYQFISVFMIQVSSYKRNAQADLSQIECNKTFSCRNGSR